MKINIFLILFAFIAFTQCETPGTNVAQAEKINDESQVGHTENHAAINKPFYQGTVVETINAGSYTYLKIKENLAGHKHLEDHVHKDFWIAVERCPAQVGDVVRFQKELLAEHFYSKILDRSFDELMFASNLQYKVEN